jgi:hypothetical protein
MTGFLLGVGEEDGRRQLKAAAFSLATLLLLLGGLGVALWPKRDVLANASDIRVRNEIGSPLVAVRMNGVNYGDIGVGATTPYLKHKLASQWPDYKFSIDGMMVESNPFIIVKGLGPGKFTYVVFASQPYESHGERKRHVWTRLERGE